MTRQKSLPVTFVEFDERDLGAIAERLERLMDEKKTAEETAVRADVAAYRDEDESDEEFESRVQSALEIRTYLREAEFKVTLKGESTSQPRWDAVWKGITKRDVRVIAMRATGTSTSVDVRLPLAGESGSIGVDSDSADEYNEELGYFLQLLADRKQHQRRYLSLNWWVGPFVWVVLPTAAVVAWFLRESSASGVELELAVLVNAVIYLSLIVGVVLFLFASFITPRVAPHASVRGVGPYQSFRSATAAALWGVVGSTIFAALTIVVPALAGLSGGGR